MILEKLNLRIREITNYEENVFQKCLIPSELFPENLKPGTLAKIFTDVNKKFFYFSQIYPMKNKNKINHCFLDKNISSCYHESLNKNCDNDNKEEYMKIIQFIPMVLRTPVNHVVVELLVNENIFSSTINKENLQIIINYFLQSFFLLNNIEISAAKNQTYHKLGLENIRIKSSSFLLENNLDSCEGTEYYKIDVGTNVVIENVRLINKYPQKWKNLVQNDTTKKLNNLINDFKFQKKNACKFKPISNILLNGQPGTGKKTILNNLIFEHKCNLFTIKASGIWKQLPGETEIELKKVFENVKNFNEKFSPKELSVILIENISLLCPNQSNNTSDATNELRISSQLLSLLDDLYKLADSNTLILATASKIDQIDQVLCRNGRFTEVFLPIPDELERGNIFKALLKQSSFFHFADDDNLTETVARKTAGYVAADLESILQNINLQNLRHQKEFNFITKEKFLCLFYDIIKKIDPESIRSSNIKSYKCNVNFDNIGGINELKKTIQNSVLAPLRNKKAFDRFGLTIPKGILLFGPPGCAKTSIAKCIASEANMTFIATSGAEVYSPYVGDAEKFIINIFDVARKNSPSVIFFDEIETLAGKREISEKNDSQFRILSTLLTEMDGIGIKLSSINDHNILVIAATNRPDMLDNALIRPGRFDKLVHVKAPNFSSRLEIFNIHKMKIPFCENIDLNELAEKTKNFSGADICNVCNEAALSAFSKDFNTQWITTADFENALRNTNPSLSQAQIDWYHCFEKKFNIS